MAKNGNPKIIAIKQTVQLIDSLEQYKDLCKTKQMKLRGGQRCTAKKKAFSPLSLSPVGHAQRTLTACFQVSFK